MAKSWADMSKEERNATGMTKKEYNRSTGQSELPKYNQESSVVATSAPTPAPTQEQTENRAEAKERAQTYSADSSITKGKDLADLTAEDHSERIAEGKTALVSSQQSGYATDAIYRGPDGGMYTAKQADDAGWTPGYYNDNEKNRSLYGDDLKGFNPDTGKNLSGYTQAEQAKYDRNQESSDKMQYHRDMKGAGAVGPGAIPVNLRTDYQTKFDETGRYHNNDYDNQIISNLMNTGLKFSQIDIEREKGPNSTHGFDGLYGKMGRQGYLDNHSVGSGNFTGAADQSEYVERDEAQALRAEAQQNKYDFYNNQSINDRYGQYDWFQQSKQSALN